MTEKEYSYMVELLTLATQTGKLTWKEDQLRFSTVINECSITIYPDYDPLLGNSNYSLALANPQGMIFNTYSIDEISDESGYKCLDKLYTMIKDSIYQISESERKILSGLEELFSVSSQKKAID